MSVQGKHDEHDRVERYYLGADTEEILILARASTPSSRVPGRRQVSFFVLGLAAARIRWCTCGLAGGSLDAKQYFIYTCAVVKARYIRWRYVRMLQCAVLLSK